MKIIELSISIYPHSIGGVEKHVYNLGRELFKQGHDITLLITREPSQSCCNLNIVHGKNIIQIFRHLKRKKYDILHVHSYGNKPVGIIRNEIVILYARLLRGMKVVITPHASFEAVNAYIKAQKGIVHKIAGRLYVLMLKLFFNLFVDCIIALTPRQRKLFAKMGFPFRKIVVIPNAISDELFSRSPLYSNKRMSSKKIILNVGRINPQKGIETLIQAFSKLRNERQDVVLMLVGPDYGTYSGTLKKLVKYLGLEDSIHFLGIIEEKSLLELYERAYALVLSSQYEGFPTVVLEAAALGCPVIASDSFDTCFLNGHALLFSRGNVEELFSILKLALNNPILLERNAKGAYNAVLNYRWSLVAKKVENQYHHLARKVAVLACLDKEKSGCR